MKRLLGDGHSRLNPMTRQDGISQVVLRSGEGMVAAFELGQYFATSPDGTILQLWETTPRELHATFGPRALVWQAPLYEVRYLLTEPEAQLIWDGDCRQRTVQAGALIRITMLKDGTRIDAGPEQFFQTARAAPILQLWQLRPSAPPVREGYWYEAPSAQVQLLAQWPMDSVLWVIAERVLQAAQQRGLLRSVL